MAIQTVPGSQIDIQTPTQGARLDPGAFQLNAGAFQIDSGAVNAPGRATLGAIDAGQRGKREVAGALDNVGGALRSIADDMLKARRATIAADADFRMRAAQQSFVESLRGDQNESNWTERAKEVYDQTAQEITQAHNIPPGMKGELDAGLRGWGQALQIKAQTMAGVQSVNRAEVAVKKSYDEAGRDGDALGMLNAVQLGRTSKLDPVEMDRLEQGIPRGLAMTAIENGIRVNPKGTWDMLESGASLPIAGPDGKPIVPSKVFGQQELDRLRIHAREQTHVWQRQNLSDMVLNQADQTGMVPNSVIEDAKKSGTIDAVAGNNLIAQQDRKTRASLQHQSQVIFADVEAATKDPTAWVGKNGAELTQWKDFLSGVAQNIPDPAKRQEAYNLMNEKFAQAIANNDKDALALFTADLHDLTKWTVDPDGNANRLAGNAMIISDAAKRQEFLNDIEKQRTAIEKTGQTFVHPIQEKILGIMKANSGLDTIRAPVGVVDDAGRAGLFGFGHRDPTTAYPTTTIGDLKHGNVSQEDIEKRYGKGMTVEKVLEEATVQAARRELEMVDWFKAQKPDFYQNPKAFEIANAHRMEIERPYVMEAARASLGTKAPAVVNTADEFAALPSGAPFVFKGKRGVKN